MPSSSPTARSRIAPVALLVVLLSPGTRAHGQQARDPFETAPLRPPSASAFWEGPRVTCPASLQVPEPLRLADAVDIALCNNPQTRESWANAKARAAEVGVAGADYLPSLDAPVSLERMQTWNTPSAGGQTQLAGSLSFNYLLFDFGGRDAALEQARQSLLAADWSHNATLQSVLLNAVQAYYQLHATQEAVLSATAAEKASLTSLEATRARQRAGTATRADVLQAQTAYAQAQLDHTQAEGDAATARGILANALGLSAERALTIAQPPDLEAQRVAERAVADLIELARSKRPDLAAAQAQVRAAESSIKVQESAGKPSVFLFGAAGFTQTAPGLDPRTGAIGVLVNIPLFTGYRNTYQIQQAREQLEAQTASRDRLATDVSLDVWRAYQDLRTQGQSLTTAGELVASAEESYNAALARYKAGVGTVTDLLNAQSALAGANLQRIQARFRWNLSKVTLARAIGVLEPALLAERTPESNPATR
jgi:TolC family type I secretion outer membrane protein